MEISPWVEMDSFEFNDHVEGDNFMYEFKKDLEDIEWEDNKSGETDWIRIGSKDKERFFEVLTKFADINDSIKAYGISRDDPDTIVEEEEDLDGKTVNSQ